MRYLTCVPLLVALFASTATARPADEKGIQWKRDIRAALSEAEDRGACLLLYLTRDD